MQEVLKRISDLRQLSGNAQLSYLECVKSPLLREVLEYTLDTGKKYKITEKKYDKATLPLFNTNLISLDMNQPLTLDLWEKFTAELDYLASVKSAISDRRIVLFSPPVSVTSMGIFFSSSRVSFSSFSSRTYTL